MRLYRPEFIADLAKNEPDRRDRAKIARAGGDGKNLLEYEGRKEPGKGG